MISGPGSTSLSKPHELHYLHHRDDYYEVRRGKFASTATAGEGLAVPYREAYDPCTLRSLTSHTAEGVAWRAGLEPTDKVGFGRMHNRFQSLMSPGIALAGVMSAEASAS